MIGKQKPNWIELCELAANEQDPQKLMALVLEIDRMLEEKQKRLNKASTPIRETSSAT